MAYVWWGPRGQTDPTYSHSKIDHDGESTQLPNMFRIVAISKWKTNMVSSPKRNTPVNYKSNIFICVNNKFIIKIEDICFYVKG